MLWYFVGVYIIKLIEHYMGARSIGAATWRSLARAQRTSEIFYNKERETSYLHVISSTYLIDLVVYVFWLRFNHVNQYRVSY